MVVQAQQRVGFTKLRRAAETAVRVTHPSAWSLISPMACKKACAVVGPTKAQPRRLSSRDSAIDAGDVETPRAAAYSDASGSKAPHERAQRPLGIDQLAGAAGVVDDRLDLAAVPHDALVGEQARHVGGAVGGDAPEVEAVEGGPEALAFGQDRAPAQARLEGLQAQLLEEPAVVGNGKSPLVVVVGQEHIDTDRRLATGRRGLVERPHSRAGLDEKAEARVGTVRGEGDNRGRHDALGHEGILVEPALQQLGCRGSREQCPAGLVEPPANRKMPSAKPRWSQALWAFMRGGARCRCSVNRRVMTYKFMRGLCARMKIVRLRGLGSARGGERRVACSSSQRSMRATSAVRSPASPSALASVATPWLQTSTCNARASASLPAPIAWNCSRSQSRNRTNSVAASARAGWPSLAISAVSVPTGQP